MGTKESIVINDNQAMPYIYSRYEMKSTSDSELGATDEKTWIQKVDCNLTSNFFC